jgi:hypothetical protein
MEDRDGEGVLIMTKRTKGRFGMNARAEEDREFDRQKADSRDTQWNLVRSAAVVKSEPPLEIPRGMTLKRYQSVQVQYGD